jgi:hypothetical protein
MPTTSGGNPQGRANLGKSHSWKGSIEPEPAYCALWRPLLDPKAAAAATPRLPKLAAHQDTTNRQTRFQRQIDRLDGVEPVRSIERFGFNDEMQCSLRTPDRRASLKQRSSRDVAMPRCTHAG